MTKQLRPAIVLFIVLTVITGVIYPLTVTVVAQVMFPAQANGSLITVDGKVVGSELIGQMNTDNTYFWSRPSGIAYNPVPSGATNLGPASDALDEAVAAREASFRSANNVPADVVVPNDMLFASASGIDPHISPESARLQIDRVATARGLDRAKIADLVEQYVEQPQLGFLGQARVNVLKLNLALDALQ